MPTPLLTRYIRDAIKAYGYDHAPDFTEYSFERRRISVTRLPKEDRA